VSTRARKYLRTDLEVKQGDEPLVDFVEIAEELSPIVCANRHSWLVRRFAAWLPTDQTTNGSNLPTGANYQREQTRWRSPALLALQACRLLFFVHRSIAWGLFTRNESHEIPQKKFFAAILWPFGRELGSQTDIGAAMDPIRAPGNPLWQMFGTRTASPEIQRETDVGRVCVCLTECFRRYKWHRG